MKYLIVLSIRAAHFINSARLTKSAQLILCAISMDKPKRKRSRFLVLMRSKLLTSFVPKLAGFPILGGFEQSNTSAKTAKSIQKITCFFARIVLIIKSSLKKNSLLEAGLL